MSKIAVPKITISILLLSVMIYCSGHSDEWFVYDRSQPTQWWRYLLASFTHYDFHHLFTNLLAFAILGSLLETVKSAAALIFIVLTTIVATIFCLHFFLLDYWVFAGISCINYAMLGYLLFLVSGRRLIGSLAALLLVGCYQFVIVLGSGVLGSGELLPLQIKPVWQLHLLALSLGMFFAVGSHCVGSHYIVPIECIVGEGKKAENALR